MKITVKAHFGMIRFENVQIRLDFVSFQKNKRMIYPDNAVIRKYGIEYL